MRDLLDDLDTAGTLDVQRLAGDRPSEQYGEYVRSVARWLPAQSST